MRAQLRHTPAHGSRRKGGPEYTSRECDGLTIPLPDLQKLVAGLDHPNVVRVKEIVTGLQPLASHRSCLAATQGVA